MRPLLGSAVAWAFGARGALVGVLAVGTGWLFSYPGGGPGMLWPLPVGLLLLVVWGLIACRWLFRIARWLYRRVTRKAVSVHPRAVVAGLLTAGLGLAVWSDVPLRVRLELDKSELLQIASATSVGELRRKGGLRVGRDGVEWVLLGPAGSIVLITNDCPLLSECGFAYSPRGAPPEVCRDSGYQVYAHIAGPWYEAELHSSGPCG